MNLGRAKTILIFAFIGLNLFLGYQLFWPDFGRLTQVAVTSEELAATEDALNENNYYLDTSLDRAVQTSDFLTVSPYWDTKEDTIKRFEANAIRVDETEDATYYNLPGINAVAHSSGLIQIFFDPGLSLEEELSDLDESDLNDLVEQFLSDEEILPDGALFDYLDREDDDVTVLYYKQMLEDKPIFASQLKAVIQANHLQKVEIYWLKPIERIPEREMEVIPANEALNNLANTLGPSTEERSINDIRLGYFSGEYDAEKWEIPPVWRIELDGKQHYYINAFTGNMEQEKTVSEKLPDEEDN